MIHGNLPGICVITRQKFNGVRFKFKVELHLNILLLYALIRYIFIHTYLDFRWQAVSKHNEERNLICRMLNRPPPRMPPGKVWKPKCANLPILGNYQRSLPASYWLHWNKRNFEQVLPTSSWVSSSKLRELCSEVGYSGSERLNRVCLRLEQGADIGCKGQGRLPTFSKNAPSMYKHAPKVADALQTWINQGIAVGPLLREEVPWQDISINSIMVKEKPDLSARIILNLSSPKNKLGPTAVNLGIAGKEFEARMSSTSKFVESLARAGVGAKICKSDWSSAYKHQHVRTEDLKLQFVEFGGMLFCELMLVFGAISSPGIYDDLAKVVLACAILKSKIDPEMVQQHLDDVCACGTDRDGTIYEFDKAYREVSERVGVRLASREDPDKSFGPATEGLVLGVWYDSKSWTWNIREDKLARIIEHLGIVIRRDQEVTVGHMLSLAGKLVDVRFLVPGGKFQIGHIIAAANSGMDKAEVLSITGMCADQCRWWVIHLQAAAFRSPIVRPVVEMSPSAIKCWTDAAGGSSTKIGQGLGGVLPPHAWFYIPWPNWINLNKPNSDGVRFGRKLTCLEILGPLVMLAGSPDMCRNTELISYVDNQGSVDIWRKGFSTSCMYSYTIAKAINDVSKGLNCQVQIVKIRRCSDAGSVAADALSKADFRTFREIMPKHDLEMVSIPSAISRWLMDPVVDMEFGEKILMEMARSHKILGFES